MKLKTPKSSQRSCEIVSHIADKDGNVIFDENKINGVLAKKAHIIKDYAWIVHNRDVYTDEEEKQNPDHKAGTTKPSHIHLLIRFEREQPQHLKNIAQWFDLPENLIQVVKGRWEDAVLYLVHQNAPEKFQYDPDDVVANFHVKTIIDHAKERKLLNQTLQRILDGEIREYNKAEEIDNLMLVHQAKKINDAFKVRAEILQATKQNRNTEVIFITGPSGCGKTTLAKKIATERKLAYYVSSGSNDVMDGYAQQPCLILDDIRPSCLGLSDLLKLLDNHTATLVKSRYKNKYLNCELIILTSVLDIEMFYSNVFERENEPITQLKRRCGTYIQMFPNSIIISRWDNATMQYSAPQLFKNDILDQFVAEKPKTAEEVQREISDLLPFLTPDIIPDEIVQSWSEKSTGSKHNAEEIVSNEEFLSLMPTDEGIIRK